MTPVFKRSIALFEELLLCVRYYVKHFITIIFATNFFNSVQLKAHSVLGNVVLSVEMKWYTSWIWFLPSPIWLPLGKGR